MNIEEFTLAFRNSRSFFKRALIRLGMEGVPFFLGSASLAASRTFGMKRLLLRLALTIEAVATSSAFERTGKKINHQK